MEVLTTKSVNVPEVMRRIHRREKEYRSNDIKKSKTRRKNKKQQKKELFPEGAVINCTSTVDTIPHKNIRIMHTVALFNKTGKNKHGVRSFASYVSGPITYCSLLVILKFKQ